MITGIFNLSVYRTVGGVGAGGEEGPRTVAIGTERQKETSNKERSRRNKERWTDKKRGLGERSRNNQRAAYGHNRRTRENHR